MKTSLLIILALASPALAERYEYDAQGRLTAVTYDDGRRIAYTHDKASNLVDVAADVETPDKGCCSSGGAPAPSIALGGIVLAMLRRRRRRSI